MSDIGYECGDCGYTPTERELQNGICPRCTPRAGPEPTHLQLAEQHLQRALRALTAGKQHGLASRCEALMLDVHNTSTKEKKP
jgi:hypothetical protein